MYHPNYSHLCKTAGETVGGRSAFAARFFYRLATNQAAETRGPPSGGVAWTTKRRRSVDHQATEMRGPPSDGDEYVLLLFSMCSQESQ